LIILALGVALHAHDLERTQVSIVFAGDGSFVAEVANDPAWLKLRLESIPGPFADRVVFWVDGREIRPEAVELKAGQESTIYRLRGHMPMHARSLRWFYGLVIDPYPLTIRRADGRMVVEEVQGDAWSRTIDLSGQFHAPILSQTTVGVAIVALLLIPVAIRMTTKLTKAREARKARTKINSFVYFVCFVPAVVSCVSWLRLR
jgi:hypothetical protein